MHLLDRQGGQLHELRPGRTTIGSSPKCTLRLEQPGVQPLHCLIVHGPEGVSVRRWAPDARLNGVPFDDASIVAGDRLAIGGIEFELVSETFDSVEAPQEAAAATFLDETEVSCSRLMDAVQESVEAITDLETVADGGAAGVAAAAEMGETLGVVEAVGIVETNAGVELTDMNEPEKAVEAVEADDPANLVAPEGIGGSGEVGEAADVDKALEIIDMSDVMEAASIVESRNAVESDDVPWTEVFSGVNKTGESTEAYVVEFEEMPAQVDQTVSAAMAADEAAELVFRELQAACAVARGRTRRMLGALRRERKQNGELLERFTDIGQQLSLLKQQPLASELSGDFVANEFAQWQAQWEELRQQFAVWEAKLGEHTQRMAELQQELVATRDHRSANVASTVAAVPKTSDTAVVTLVPDAAESAAEFVESATDSKVSQGTGSESAAITEPELEPIAEPISEVRESHWREAEVSRVEESPAVANELPRSDEQSFSSDAPAEPWAAIVDETPAPGAAGEEMPMEGEQSASVESLTHDDDHSSVANETDPGTAPAAESPWVTNRADAEWPGESEPRKSVWPMPPLPVADESHEFGVSSEASAIEVEAPAWASHLFEESARDASVENSAVERPSLNAPIANGSGAAISFGAVGTEDAAQSDEEESIEQYMAKLMQRVRGESATSGSALPTAMPQRSIETTDAQLAAATQPIARETGRAASSKDLDVDATNLAADEQSATEPHVDWEAIARRAATTAPKADMGAMRALANETARRAIGRHELKKHRRDAITKVIVSSLAGMTSLWLMLDSPSWRDIQFITACVALVAAAYWAGETLREMLESLRAATYHGPETVKQREESTPDGALPIDIEK